MTKRVAEPRLFAEPQAARAPAPTTTLADVVFDRPIDQVYTYSVPADLSVRPGVRVSLPFGRGDKIDTGYVVNVHGVRPPREVKSIVRVLDNTPLITEELLKLTRWVADYYLCGWGQALQAVLPAGVRDQAGTRNIAFVEAVAKEQLPNPLPELTPKQAVVLEHARRIDGPVEQSHLARAAKCTTAIIGVLVEKGYLRRDKRRVEREPNADDHAMTEEVSQPITMNAEQQTAWTQIEEALRTGGFHPFLVHGVTASGKTELYLRAIEEVIRHGKQAVVLVPEISLTPQTIARFKGRCGQVAVLHSNLSDAERGAQWRAVAAGQVQVIVGARSAVFAPCSRLGLVVVDEEHENTFKQETTPRYHGRDVAVMRARLEGVPVLLGSATPSLESWHNAQKGHYGLLSLTSRVLDRPLPPVHLIDLRHERPAGAISPPLEKAMRQTLAAGAQVMLLLNRRGFNTTVHCPNCGYVAPCDYCDISLTFHRQRQALVCHYCGFEKAPMTTCPICQRDAMKYFGLGTEKLHNELSEKFPGYEIRRMDSDTMSKPGSHAKVLDDFRAGKVHVLMGTQMIAKGLDFPNVTLVGVVNADIALHIPDFRAGERTFQLLAQVAGRAGRGPRGGKVLIQTYAPEHPGISYAVKHDYLGFVSQEMPQRELHQYPPYQRLARLIVRSEKMEQAAEFAERLAGAFRLGEQPGVRVLGPAECPVHKLNGYYRYHFQLQSTGSTALHHVLKTVLATVRPPSSVEFQTDVDAYAMM
jgi:primosomal protein N' (replication factor Y) (superfamily II helicase)